MKKTVNMKRLSAAEQIDLRIPFFPGFDVEKLTNGAVVEYPNDLKRPITRRDCENDDGVCPLVSCRHHLALDVNEETGAIKNNFPVQRMNEETGKIETDFTDVDFDAMKFTCSLDVAAMGKELSLEEFAETMRLSYDRAFQVIDEAKKRARKIAVEIGAAEGLAVRPTVRKQESDGSEEQASVACESDMDGALLGNASTRGKD